MDLLFTVDMKNYDANWPVINRTAVRGIIFRQGKLAMIKSDKFGELKFPGGGKNENESDNETLCREIAEETGLIVDEKSIRPFGYTLEIKKNFENKEIFKQTSLYYFCEVTEKMKARNLDDYEKEYGYNLEFTTIENAIKNNLSVPLSKEIPWKIRDTKVLTLLRDNYEKI